MWNNNKKIKYLLKKINRNRNNRLIFQKLISKSKTLNRKKNLKIIKKFSKLLKVIFCQKKTMRINSNNLCFLKPLKMIENPFNHHLLWRYKVKKKNWIKKNKKFKINKQTKMSTDQLLHLKNKLLNNLKNLILLNKFLLMEKKALNQKKFFLLIRLEDFLKFKTNKCNKLRHQILKKRPLKEFSL